MQRNYVNIAAAAILVFNFDLYTYNGMKKIKKRGLPIFWIFFLYYKEVLTTKRNIYLV